MGARRILVIAIAALLFGGVAAAAGLYAAAHSLVSDTDWRTACYSAMGLGSLLVIAGALAAGESLRQRALPLAAGATVALLAFHHLAEMATRSDLALAFRLIAACAILIDVVALASLIERGKRR